MKRTAKSILASIPLVVGLAGPASASISDAAASDSTAGSGAIDSLLNQYAGLTPGNFAGQVPATQTISNGQQYSAFTESTGVMAGYYTSQGVDRTSPNEPLVSGGGSVGSSSSTGSSTEGSGADPGLFGSASAAAPSVSSFTAARPVQDTLVGAVAASIAPASSSGGGSSPIVATGNPPQDPAPVTTTPIPPAALLIGSGLAALVPLRRRNRNQLPE